MKIKYVAQSNIVSSMAILGDVLGTKFVTELHHDPTAEPFPFIRPLPHPFSFDITTMIPVSNTLLPLALGLALESSPPHTILR